MIINNLLINSYIFWKLVIKLKCMVSNVQRIDKGHVSICQNLITYMDGWNFDLNKLS
jgi:hypothetical protein